MKIKIKNIVFIFIMSYITLNGTVIIDAETQRWTNAGFKAYDIEKWKEIDGMTLDKAKIWKELGFSSFTAKDLTKIGLTSTDELKEWFNIGVNVKDVYAWKANTPNIGEAKKWLSLGMDYNEVIKWGKKNVISADEVKIWTSIGVNYDNLWEWQRLGINSAKEAKEWLDNGYDLSKIIEFKRNGINSIAELNDVNNEKQKWIDAGVVEGMDTWKNIGITEPELAARWRKTNLDREIIKRWLAHGFIIPEEVKEWDATYFDPIEVKELINRKITPKEALQWDQVAVRSIDDLNYIEQNNLNYGEVKQWHEEGILFKDINNWKKVNINIASEAKKWISNGYYTFGTVEAYKELGINTVEEANKWRKFTESTVQIRDLISVGFSNADKLEPYTGLKSDHILKLKKWDIAPNKLIVSMAHANLIFNVPLFFTDKDTFVNTYSILEKNCKQIEGPKFFSSFSHNESKNNCYIFAAKMIERLDHDPFVGRMTKNGIANGMSGRNIYVEDFDFNWKLGENKIGVIKGAGPFKYHPKDQPNDSYDIPKGKILFVK